MKKSVRILLVEDDPNLSLLVQDYLGMMGYQVSLAVNGEEALRVFKSSSFHLIILDVMLPKLDGFQVAEMIRSTNPDIPLIFLTARGLKEDRIKGFRAGADDYVVKPFSTEELSLRIEAILKRASATAGNDEQAAVFKIGKFVFDYANLELKHAEGDRHLTRKEAELLKLLALNSNKLLTREYALRTIWGDDDYFSGRSMDVFITKLRKYLRPDPSVSIVNVHGTGFKLEAPN